MSEFLFTGDKLEQNPFLMKIDISSILCNGAERNVYFYRVMDGISPDITSKLYNDLIIQNFNENEREDKNFFNHFFEKNPENDIRRENIFIMAVLNNQLAGLLMGMVFHNSKIGYFDYLVIDKSVRSMGIGGLLFQIGKKLVKDVAKRHGYDNENLTVLLTVEKTNATLNQNSGQDSYKRLLFYKKQKCKRVNGMTCYVPGIYNTKTKKQKPPIDCFDWLICGINRDLKNNEIIMSRADALKFNIDNLDLQYNDSKGRPAKETETYKKIEQSLCEKIYTENLL